MSRSYRHTSIVGHGADQSHKRVKQTANRKLRHSVHTALHIEGSELELAPHMKGVPEASFLARDAKKYFDQDRYPNLMRK